MNSWHSFSPNSRWLVFASKGLSPFTQMFLTHIDENGDAGPPILVSGSTAANRAVNVPEFLNNKPDSIRSIKTPLQQAYRYAMAGDKLMQDAEYNEAIKQYKKAIKLDPYFNRAYLNLGTIYAVKGNRLNAAAYFKKAVEINSEDVVARCNLGFILIKSSSYDAAVAQFDEAEKINPSYADIYLGRATVLKRQGKNEQALSNYKKALSLHKDKARVLKSMLPFLQNNASLLDKQGKTDAALRLRREAADAQRQDPKAQYDFALYLNKIGKIKDAIEYYQKAIEANPDFLPAIDNLAWLFATHPDAKIRDAELAVELATKACQLTDYQEPLLLDSLAAAYAEAGRFSDALRVAQNALAYARAMNHAELEQKISSHIELFKNNKPYREDPTKEIITVRRKKPQ